jgi:hypothetical protein
MRAIFRAPRSRGLTLLLAAALLLPVAGCEPTTASSTHAWFGYVQGAVTNSAGAPVAGVHVAAEHHTSRSSSYRDGGAGLTRTDAAGRFEGMVIFAEGPMPDSRYFIVVRPPEGSGLRADTVPFDLDWRSLQPFDSVQVDVHLEAL